MNVKITPSVPCGKVKAPPSKSYAHRLLICAALARGNSVISGISESEDMLAALDCISSLGVSYEKNGDRVTVHGADSAEKNACFSCRESGNTLRFLIPVALARTERAVFKGTERLMQRGIGIYEKMFAEKGIKTEKSKDTLTFTGKLTPGEYEMPGNISSQFASGLLFALPLLDGDSVLRVLPPVESRPYIDITLDAVSRFGIKIEERESNVFYIKGSQHYINRDESVEGDWSNAASIAAFSALGADVALTGVNHDSIQGDRICLEHLRALENRDAEIDISNCPDLGPVLFAVAAALGGARFTGTKRLRIKESDRASAMAEELEKFGIKTDVEENSVIVYNGKLKAPCEKLDSHNDHRIVMAMTLLASLVGGEIENAEAVNKTYPDYFKDMSGIGLEVSYGT